MRVQKIERLGLKQRSAAVGARDVHDAMRGRRHRDGRRRGCRRWTPQPVRVIRERAQGEYGRLDRAVQWDAAAPRTLQRLGLQRREDAVEDDRLAVLAQQTGKALARVGFGTPCPKTFPKNSDRRNPPNMPTTSKASISGSERMMSAHSAMTPGRAVRRCSRRRPD